ncbi:hypothetical protein AB3N59_11870 [Leptospira sp. WS92.C1]
MKIDPVTVLKSATKASFTILTNILFFFMIGLTFNLILLVFLFPEMQSLTSNLGGLPVARAGGIGAILALIIIVIELWPITLMVLNFGFLFPFLHFLFGKKYGIAKALYFMIGDNSPMLSSYLSERLETYIRKKTEIDKNKEKNFSIAKQIQNLPSYLSKLEELPSPIRFLASKLSEKLKIGTLLEDISKQIPDRENPNPEDLQLALKKTIEYAIQETVLPPTFGWFFKLYGINLGIFLILKFLL